MRRVVGGTLIGIILMCGLWLGYQGVNLTRPTDSGSSQTKPQDAGSIGGPEITSPIQTKRGNREAAGPRATHAPGRLKEFMLPEVVIDGLSLDGALRKLMEVYNDTCEKTGETPLRLTFDVPPGTTKKLNLRLSGRNFTSSIQLLAALSGMKATRSGLIYQFTPFTDERKPVSRGIRVPPDISSTLSGLAGQGAVADSPVNELVRKLILDLDPSTRLSLTASGILNLETTSTADAAAVSALIEGISSQKPIQHKFTSMVINLSAGAEWTAPVVSEMSDSQLRSFMRGLAQTQGADLITMPSITSRGGQSGTIELIREWTAPNDDSGETLETHNVGQVMQLQGSPLGFGHDLAYNFTDTTAEVDPETGKPDFIKRIDVKDKGFSGDNGTRFVVQTRPDGSRAVVLVTSSLIDATGRPIHGAE